MLINFFLPFRAHFLTKKRKEHVLSYCLKQNLKIRSHSFDTQSKPHVLKRFYDNTI